MMRSEGNLHNFWGMKMRMGPFCSAVGMPGHLVSWENAGS